MAIEPLSQGIPLNVTDIGGEIGKNLIENLPSGVTSGLSTLITIGKAVGIAVLIYIMFLIIKAIVQIGSARRIKRIAKNVEDINKKMDILVSDKKKKIKK